MFDKIKSSIEDIIVRNVDFPLSREDIELCDGDLKALGVNSLSLIKMLAEIQSKFTVEIDLEFVPIEILYSVDQMSKLVESKLSTCST